MYVDKYVDKPLRGHGLMPVGFVQRCPRSGKCLLLRDSILCGYGLGRDTWVRVPQSAQELSRGPQRGKQVLDGHAHSVVRVDKACVNDPISANDEGGGNREHPIVGTL